MRVFCLAVKRGQASLGFPGWGVVRDWLNEGVIVNTPDISPIKQPTLKNPEIPGLSSYKDSPGDEFWKSFPFKKLPEKAETAVLTDVFAELIEKSKDKMTNCEYRRARKVISDLTLGAESYQLDSLPPLITANAKSALEHGQLLTDTIATWVKKGFVAGPFDCPPVSGFRANPLGVVVRNGKIRPILNMSGPKGRSFNDNVNRSRLERLHMGTAKQFSYALKNAGIDAVFSKFDIQDAYKLMPSRVEDFRLQGFSWLGKYFVETRQPFGGVPAPANFDRLGKTKDLVVCLNSGTPRNSVFRALDDSPCVGRSDSDRVKKFSLEMRNFCEKTNIPLADNCPAAEKAFELVKKGTVLGVGFDSTDMTWFLSKDKADKVVTRCLNAARSSHMELKQVQQLTGSINDVAQMCPAMNFHKWSGNNFLKRFGGNENLSLMVPDTLRKDLLIIAKMVDSSRTGLPVAESPAPPTLSAMKFYTDAAGVNFSMHGGKRFCHNNSGKGVSCVGGDSEEDVWGWTRLSWPENLLTTLQDEKGIFFGHKSTTLESVGLLLPLLVFPDKIAGRNIIFMVDNMAVLYGWSKGVVKNDYSATEVLKAVQYLASFLGVTVYVEHVPRMSDPMAAMADELSRKSKDFSGRTTRNLKNALHREVSSCLTEWLSNPCASSLCEAIMKEAGEKHPKYCFA